MKDSDTSKPYRRLTANENAKIIFADMFSPTIMLLLGGFSLAAALSKHHVAKLAASFILSRAGSKPQWVLLANMFVSTFASMWISNVAAPVLCFSLVSVSIFYDLSLFFEICNINLRMPSALLWVSQWLQTWVEWLHQ